MDIIISHDWNVSLTTAKGIQKELFKKVEFSKIDVTKVKKVLAVDISYHRKSKLGFAVMGVFNVSYDMDRRIFNINQYSIHKNIANVSFPYIPGFLSFREIPLLIPLLNNFKDKPDLVLVDGAGIAHPRKMGLASHIGVIYDIPTIGCAKSRLIGDYDEPGTRKGSFSYLYYKGEVVGAVLRTRDYTRPLFISPGNKTDIESSVSLVLSFCTNYRIPEPIRIIDSKTKKFRKEYERGKNAEVI
ncbi:MAG: endonuclease V [Candidatus Marinimicrobia bacterium]|nr:endonuclease V [Candidatus Neomarinimicrobiota bacterium]